MKRDTLIISDTVRRTLLKGHPQNGQGICIDEVISCALVAIEKGRKVARHSCTPYPFASKPVYCRSDPLSLAAPWPSPLSLHQFLSTSCIKVRSSVFGVHWRCNPALISAPTPWKFVFSFSPEGWAGGILKLRTRMERLNKEGTILPVGRM